MCIRDRYETFPIWNLPLKHPVNLAYEAATADLNDVNMIDPFHLEAYGVTTVNYNRDVEIFPVLAAMFRKIQGECPYKSPTDMGVNMAGFAIIDDDACQEASRMETVSYTHLDVYKRQVRSGVRGLGRRHHCVPHLCQDRYGRGQSAGDADPHRRGGRAEGKPPPRRAGHRLSRIHI